MLSRVFGFVRDILIAAVLGAGTVADTFFVAFRFPNLFRRLFAEGAFAAAFIPIFSSILEQEGREKAREFVDHAFAALLVILALFVALMELAMPWAMWVLAPGFDEVEGKMEMATEMSRIAFPYLLFISLVSLQSGVLNSLGRFAAAAAAPVLLNLVLIAAMACFSRLARASELVVTRAAGISVWRLIAPAVVTAARSDGDVRTTAPRASRSDGTNRPSASIAPSCRTGAARAKCPGRWSLLARASAGKKTSFAGLSNAPTTRWHAWNVPCRARIARMSSAHARSASTSGRRSTASPRL